MQTSFMKPVYFSIDRGIVTHPDQWIITKLQIEKAFITMRHLDRSMYGVLLILIKMIIDLLKLAKTKRYLVNLRMNLVVK